MGSLGSDCGLHSGCGHTPVPAAASSTMPHLPAAACRQETCSGAVSSDDGKVRQQQRTEHAYRGDQQQHQQQCTQLSLGGTAETTKERGLALPFVRRADGGTPSSPWRHVPGMPGVSSVPGISQHARPDQSEPRHGNPGTGTSSGTSPSLTMKRRWSRMTTCLWLTLMTAAASIKEAIALRLPCCCCRPRLSPHPSP